MKHFSALELILATWVPGFQRGRAAVSGDTPRWDAVTAGLVECSSLSLVRSPRPVGCVSAPFLFSSAIFVLYVRAYLRTDTSSQL